MTVLEIKEKVLQKYGADDKRYQHIIGVYRLATTLATKYGVDVESAQIAALMHDFYKRESIDELLAVIDDENIVKKYADSPFVYHALASAKAAFNMGITDPDILAAIENHVLGRKNMSRLEEIIFIADYCEENRTYQDCVDTRDVLRKSLYQAIYMSLYKTIVYLRENGYQPLPIQIELCEFYHGKGNTL